MKTPGKKNPFARLAVLVAGGSALLVACVYLLANRLGERAWENYLRKMRNPEGLSLRPKVPDDQNFAKTPLLEQNGYKDRNPGSPMTGLGRAQGLINFNSLADFRRGNFTHLGAGSASTNSTLTPADLEAAQDILDQMSREKDISELLDASKRPYSRFDMEMGFEGPIPNFVLLREIAQIFQYRAFCFLALNQPADAAAQMRVLDQATEGLRGSPTLVAAMIRTAMIGLQSSPFYEGWARRQWSIEQYSQFQKMFSRVDCLENFNFCMMTGERAGVAEFVNANSAREMLQKINFTGIDETKEPIRALLMNTYLRSMPRGWWQKNLMEHHRILDGMRTNLYDVKRRIVFAQNDQRTITWFDKELRRAKPFHYIAGAAIPNFVKALRVVALQQTSCDQAAIVCALERYAAKYGAYPDSLQSLVPEFMSSLPNDLITGQPPIYRKKENATFLLYSVGWDGTDNSAPPGPNDYHTPGQDFVWPFAKFQ